MVYTYNGILVSLHKKGNSDIHTTHRRKGGFCPRAHEHVLICNPCIWSNAAAAVTATIKITVSPAEQKAKAHPLMPLTLVSELLEASVTLAATVAPRSGTPLAHSPQPPTIATVNVTMARGGGGFLPPALQPSHTSALHQQHLTGTNPAGKEVWKMPFPGHQPLRYREECGKAGMRLKGHRQYAGVATNSKW